MTQPGPGHHLLAAPKPQLHPPAFACHMTPFLPFSPPTPCVHTELTVQQTCAPDHEYSRSVQTGQLFLQTARAQARVFRHFLSARRTVAPQGDSHSFLRVAALPAFSPSVRGPEGLGAPRLVRMRERGGGRSGQCEPKTSETLESIFIQSTTCACCAPAHKMHAIKHTRAHTQKMAIVFSAYNLSSIHPIFHRVKPLYYCPLTTLSDFYVFAGFCHVSLFCPPCTGQC